MQDTHGDAAREAEGDEAAARIHREGFRALDADQRGERAELFGDVSGLLLEGGGLRRAGIAVAEDAGAIQADAGAQTGLAGEQFHHFGGREGLLRAQKRAEQELVGIGIELFEAQEGMTAAGLARRCGSWGSRSRRRRWGGLGCHFGLWSRFGAQKVCAGHRGEEGRGGLHHGRKGLWRQTGLWRGCRREKGLWSRGRLDRSGRWRGCRDEGGGLWRGKQRNGRFSRFFRLRSGFGCRGEWID